MHSSIWINSIYILSIKYSEIDDSLIKNGFEYLFALIDRSPEEALEIEYIHEKEKRKLRLILSELELLTPVPEEGMKSGIRFEAFSGKWNKLPDFNSTTNS